MIEFISFILLALATFGLYFVICAFLDFLFEQGKGDR